MKKSPAVILFKVGEEKGKFHVFKKVGKKPWVKVNRTGRGQCILPRNGFLQVTAGIENQWEVAPDELDALAGMFAEVVSTPGAVVVVRNGVQCTWHDLPAPIAKVK